MRATVYALGVLVATQVVDMSISGAVGRKSLFAVESSPSEPR